MSTHLPTLKDVNLTGKTVLLRGDLNVPMEGGRISDDTRMRRLKPTIEHLQQAGARTVILSHFGRPEGRYVPSMSLAPLVDSLSAMLGADVKFGVDCVGDEAEATAQSLQNGEVALMENLRFHIEEEAGDDEFASKLARLGEIVVNDAFSCSHRAHASITGLPAHLPAYAGKLLEEEVDALTRLCSHADKPLTAIVGGAKVSSKLGLLEHLVQSVDTLIIGGAMANTFLHAKGIAIGRSLYEAKLVKTAKTILQHAEQTGCSILLPVDGVVSDTLTPHAACSVVGIDHVPDDSMIIDIGPETAYAYGQAVKASKTVVWNGPMGAFETTPFDNGTVTVARFIARYTADGTVNSVAGGGDTIAAVGHAGLKNNFTYLSTAGGAFLAWLEGKSLPGVVALTVNRHPRR